MKEDKVTAKPQEQKPLSLTVDSSVWDRLNVAAKETGRSNASIIREGLFMWLRNHEQTRGAK